MRQAFSWARGPRSALAIGLPALILGAALAGPAAATPTVLPTGGQVVGGKASIGAAIGSDLTITQSSPKAIINWTSFSVGRGGEVTFDNGSGITLNRVTGGSVAQIDGLIDASGGVYVLDPNGVIIGKTGIVNVGGDFVASSLALSNAAFLAGGNLTFTGQNAGPVANLGYIVSAKGDVALIGPAVANDGQIAAAQGDVGLGAGSAVEFFAEDGDQGRLSVLVGGAGTSATNRGLIQSAEAELKANGGDIYALAVKPGQGIEVTGVSSKDGNVWLIAENGTVTATGRIEARGADGSGRLVETSGETVNFDGLRVTAGEWLVDPVNLTVNSAAAATIDANLATTNVLLQTTATSASGPGAQSSGAGDIIIASPVSWSSGKSLTLDAYHSILVDANVTVAGGGQVVLKTDDGGSGGDYSFAPGASLSFGTQTGGNGQPAGLPGQALTINGAAYTLVYSESGLLAVNSDLSGDYALAAPLSLQGFVFTDSPIARDLSTEFTGVFEGLGNAISSLAIDQTIAEPQTAPNGSPSNGYVGLFGVIGANGAVRDLTLSGAEVSGGDGTRVGALAGLNLGLVLDDSSSGEVDIGNAPATTPAAAGGLVGADILTGRILDSSSSASVSGGSAAYVGGLVGSIADGATATGSYASGSVAVGQDGSAGGFAGLVDGQTNTANPPQAVTLADDYATGPVSGGASSSVGGFAGIIVQAQVSTSYATGNVTQLQGAAAASDTEDNAGGFVAETGAGANIIQSYSSGDVATAAGPTGGPYTTAGGFAGLDTGGSITNSYSLGSVTVSGGTVSQVGGFAGVVWNGASVSQVYATGHVSGGGTTAGLVAVVGYSVLQDTSGSISDSYWDEGTTGQTVGYNIGPGSTGTATNITAIGGTTTLSPYAAATYANLDLSSVWYLIPGETRPILRSEYSTTIVNTHQLQLMALDLSADYTIAANIDASETSSASGVWNPANGFAPVGGTTSAPFTGSLNGQGFTISNLTIIDTTGSAQMIGPYELNGFVGLFGVLSSTASVENLAILGASVTGGNGMEAGILAGGVQGSVQNVSTSGEVTAGAGVTFASGAFSPASGGGMAGVVVGGTIGGSNSSANVTAGLESGAGGFAGALLYGAKVSNSSASGSVVSAGGTANQGSVAGGFAGYINGSPIGQGNPVTVTLTGDGATGSVTAGNLTVAGGFAGAVQYANISNSFATGATQVNGVGEVGGFAGELSTATQVTNSYATGAVSEPVAEPDDSTVGGFVGAMLPGATITGSWSGGDVSAAGSTLDGGENYLGGFVGVEAGNASITDAYSLGFVTVLNRDATVTGGFAGEVDGSISNFYATGPVNTNANGSSAGGLIGVLNESATATDGYWDEGTTGETTAVASGSAGATLVGIGGSTGLSPYAAATYANFDLSSVWYLVEGETRPILRSEYSTTITNDHQLELMSLNLSANYRLVTDFSASETESPYGVFNPANGFVPVGTVANPFTGTFNGDGHTISNLFQVVATGSEQTFAGGLRSDGFGGVFGVVDGPSAVIQNVNLTNVLMSGGDGTVIGALVGALVEGSVQNASSTGEVIQSNALVDGNGNAVLASVGGLVGALGTSGGNGVSASISDSSSIAAVEGGDTFAGGLVGATLGAASITGSWATGTAVVTATTGTAGEIAEAGGLVGSVFGATLSNDYAEEVVEGQAGASVGGFAGYIGSSQVTASWAVGEVIQGAAGSSFSNYAGGFVGYQDTGSTITRSFASVAVSTQGASGAPPTFAGGFVGYTIGQISQAYATGPVTSTGASDNVGGFAGEIDAGGEVDHVYATGLVTAAGPAAGGLAGLLNGSLSNSFWDEGTTGLTTGYPGQGTSTSDIGMGGNTGVSPYLAATYAGWDFASTWSQPSQGEYPELLGVSHVLEVVAGQDTSVYGQYPIYTYTVLGVQDADIQYLSPIAEAPTGITFSTSGWYDAGTYALDTSSLTATGGSGGYRSIYVPGTLTVTPAPLTVSLTGAIDKTYDGTTNAAITDSNLSLSGVISGDMVNAAAEGGAYATKDVGTGIVVTASGVELLGADSANYTVSSTASGAVGQIDPKALTVSLVGIVDKTYDGTTNAVLAASNYQLSGVIAGDSVGLNDPTSGSYAGKDVGTAINVSVGGLALTGADARDYTVATTANGDIGEIDPKALTVTLTGVVDKTYDGTTAAFVSQGNYQLSGVVAGDSVALNNPTNGSYASKDVGSGILVTVGGLALTGAAAKDYTVSSTASGDVGEIDPRMLSVYLVGTVDKTYDGTTSATLSASNYQVNGVVEGDSVALNDPTAGIYETKNVGTELNVSVSGLALTGADAKDYTVATSTNNDIGEIDPKALTVTLTGVVTKTYDGTTNATLTSSNYQLSGLIGTDQVSLNDPTNGSYATKNAGSNINVTVNGLALSGADAQDYTIGGSANGDIGQINRKMLTIALTGTVDKTYDGTTNATLSVSNYQLNGVVEGDQVTLNDATAGTYASKNVGKGIAVTVDGLVLTGSDETNYTVATSVTGDVGQIDPKALTATLVGTVTKTYDGNNTASLTSANYQLSGVVGTDDVTLDDPTTGTYDNSQVGTNKVVTVTGLMLSGAGDGNYTVNGTTSAPIGSITGAPQVFQIQVITPTQVETIDQSLTAEAAEDQAEAAGEASPETATSTYTVFPISPSVASTSGEAPLIGAGNGDLWVGSDLDPGQTCPAGADKDCKKP